MSKIDNWYVFDCMVYCGILSYNEDTGEFSFKLENDCPRARTVMKVLHTNDSQSWFRESILDRVFPPNRVNVNELLRKLGMHEYNSWEIVKRAHLASANDTIWMDKVKDPEGFYKYHPASCMVPREVAMDKTIGLNTSK